MADDLHGEIVDAAHAESTPAAAPTQDHKESTGTADAATRVPTATPDDHKGWLPPDVHERIVGGFHQRLDEVAWAKGLKREEVEEALAIRRQLHSREKQGHEPQPDAKDDRGELFYTPQQAAKWAAWQAQQIVDQRMQEIESRIGPIESTFARSQQEQTLGAQIAQAQTWPGFSDHIDAITQAITNARLSGRPISLAEAYIQTVTPNLVASEKKKWLAELNQTSEVVKDDLSPSKRPSAVRKDRSKMSLRELTEDAFASARK